MGRLSGSLAVALLAALVAWPAPADDEADDGFRFGITRTREFLFRIDTATGMVWAVRPNGDGGWQPVGSAPSQVEGEPVPGRYGLAVQVRRRAEPGGPTTSLIRTDRSSGRAWVKKAIPDGEWTELGQPPGDDDATVPE